MNGENRTINIEIDVSDDMLEAYATLSSDNENLRNPHLIAEQIKEALSQKGIVYGIKNAIINQIENNIIRVNEKVLIASGERPKDGDDGKIEYAFDTDKSVKVANGEKIGEIIPPVHGEEGVTVYNKKLRPSPVHEAKIPKLQNVIKSPENEYILIAETDGYLIVDNAGIQVKPFFELDISEDKYSAYITVVKPLDKTDFNRDDVIDFIGENGVKYGILNENIARIFEHDTFDQRILAAKGKKVIDGKNGEIKYYFETQISPKMDEHGNIDYKELNLIQYVHKGTALAEVMPPEPGADGVSVYDEKIRPAEGTPSQLPAGKNTRPDDNNPTILISEIDGNVKFKGGKVEVDQVITIKNNVDYSTGNIDFKGHVNVNGDVKSGFSIISQDDIQINGVVEDSDILSDGNVLLKSGFVGKGKGKIVAHGNVAVKFCENQMIHAYGDIFIGDFTLHSNIRTHGTLTISGKDGLVLGGKTYATKGIELKTAGNDNDTPTALVVGVDDDLNKKITEMKAEMKELSTKQISIEEVIRKIIRMELLKKDLPENKKNLLNTLKEVKATNEIEKKNTMTEIETMHKQIEELKKATVVVHNTVCPETSITIYDTHMIIKEPMKSVVFHYGEDELIVSRQTALEK